MKIRSAFVTNSSSSSFIIMGNEFSYQDVTQYLEELGAIYSVEDLANYVPNEEDEEFEEWHTCTMPDICEKYISGLKKGKFSSDEEFLGDECSSILSSRIFLHHSMNDELKDLDDFKQVYDYSQKMNTSLLYETYSDSSSCYLNTEKFCSLCREMGLAEKRGCKMLPYGFTWAEQKKNGRFFLYGSENANDYEVMEKIKEHFHIPDELAVFHRG